MKASVPLLGGCVALGLTFSVNVSRANSLSADLWSVVTASAGQVGGGRDKRADSDKLLSQAQKAIKLGDFALAESLIVQAEKLGVKYNPLTERFIDNTPDKVRKALAEARSKAPPTKAIARAPALLDGNHGRPQAAAIPQDPLAAAPLTSGPPTYNIADDQAVLPQTGMALFSAVRVPIRTHDFALIASTALSGQASNQLRLSYGQTRLSTEEERNPFLLPSTELPQTPFLLNAPLLERDPDAGTDPITARLLERARRDFAHDAARPIDEARYDVLGSIRMNAQGLARYWRKHWEREAAGG